MLKFILIGLSAVIVIFLVVAAIRPDDFRVTRTATFAASPASVFKQVNNLRNWNAWSPWAKLDPDVTNTFDGPPAGVGASFAWAGNSKVGAGKMTITESKPAQLVGLKLEFIRPFAATNTTEFVLKPEGAGTTVSWSMAGKNNFMSKCLGLVMNCEKIVGGQFDEGLANLRAIVEPVPAT